MRAQEPAAALAAASETVAPEPAKKPAAAEQEKAPKRTKADDDDDDRPARPRRKAAATPIPIVAAATATPKPGFFKRVFGSKKPAATPAPISSTPTPKPKPKAKKDDEEEVKPKPKKDDDEEAKPKKPADPDSGDAGEPNLTAKPPKATPTPRGKKGATTKEPVKAAAGQGAAKEQAALEHALKGGDADAIEKARYDYARARAVEDEHVRDLKAKADGATSEDEGRKGLRAYNRALFEKMRKLEPSISERIDRMETAVLKRIGGEE